jgi:hypothetical protein
MAERWRIAEYGGGLAWVEIEANVTNPDPENLAYDITRVFWQNDALFPVRATVYRQTNGQLIGTATAEPGTGGSMNVTGPANNRRGVTLQFEYPAT